MAYVRVPTGRKILTITATKKSYLRYCCVNCGKPSLHEHLLSASGEGTYHVLQSRKSKDLVHEEVAAAAEEAVKQKDLATKRKINQMQDYSDIIEEVVCPYCGAVQPWSKRKQAFSGDVIGWAGLFFAPILILIALLAPSMTVKLVCGGLCILVAGIALAAVLTRKKSEDHIQEESFDPPVYYTEFYMDALDRLEKSGFIGTGDDEVNTNNK